MVENLHVHGPLGSQDVTVFLYWLCDISMYYLVLIWIALCMLSCMSSANKFLSILD